MGSGYGTESTDPTGSVVSVESPRGDYRELIFLLMLRLDVWQWKLRPQGKVTGDCFNFLKENFFSFPNRMSLRPFFCLRISYGEKTIEKGICCRENKKSRGPERVIFLPPAHPRNQFRRKKGERYLKMEGYPDTHAE